MEHLLAQGILGIETDTRQQLRKTGKWYPLISRPSSEDAVLVFFFLIYFLAVLGLRFCARAFSSCGERGPLFIAVRGPLTVAASLVAEHGLQTRRLSRYGARA